MMPEPTEVQVPTPNRSACGFRFLSERHHTQLCKWMDAQDRATDDTELYECYVVRPRDCGIGKVLNALYARQEADRKGESPR